MHRRMKKYSAVRSFCLSLMLFGTTALLAQKGNLPETGGKHTLSYGEALALGLVEGVTEFLPVSSTGHLILADHFMDLDGKTAGAGDAASAGAFQKAVDAYIIVIQGGAIAAVLILYWRQVWSVLMGVLGRDRQGLLLGRNLLAAFLPAAVFGLFFEEMIGKHLFGAGPVALALAAGALLMLGVETWRGKKKNDEAGEGPELHELTVAKSLLIGVMQCVAMWPGTSRSMMAIVGGYFAGLSPRRAAEFSFLLGLITLGAASCYKALQAGPEAAEIIGWGPGLAGAAAAAVSAAAAVKWMIAYLTRHGLAVFAWYRLILALLVVLFLWR